MKKSKISVEPKDSSTKSEELATPKDMPQTRPAPSLKPKVETPAKQIINKSVARLSIKEMLEKEKALKNKSSETLPEEKYTADRLTRIWRQFAFQVKDNGKETFYNALVKRDPLIEKNDLLKLFLDNQIQVDYITPLLNDLISFLRNSLKNHNINVQIELIKNPVEDVKFMNGRDKFAAMAKNNPELNTLKNLFNLDIDF